MGPHSGWPVKVPQWRGIQFRVRRVSPGGVNGRVQVPSRTLIPRKTQIDLSFFFFSQCFSLHSLSQGNDQWLLFKWKQRQSPSCTHTHLTIQHRAGQLIKFYFPTKILALFNTGNEKLNMKRSLCHNSCHRDNVAKKAGGGKSKDSRGSSYSSLRC